jgi:hypothetical protein
MYSWKCRQVAQQEAQRMMAPNLIVSVGDQQENTRVSQAAAEKPNQIERCLIRPVSVLEYDQGCSGRGAELIEYEME